MSCQQRTTMTDFKLKLRNVIRHLLHYATEFFHFKLWLKFIKKLFNLTVKFP